MRENNMKQPKTGGKERFCVGCGLLESQWGPNCKSNDEEYKAMHEEKIVKTPPPQEKEEPKQEGLKEPWENDFDTRFVNHAPVFGWQQIHPSTDARTIKAFIRSLISEERKKTRKIIEQRMYAKNPIDGVLKKLSVSEEKK